MELSEKNKILWSLPLYKENEFRIGDISIADEITKEGKKQMFKQAIQYLNLCENLNYTYYSIDDMPCEVWVNLYKHRLMHDGCWQKEASFKEYMKRIEYYSVVIQNSEQKGDIYLTYEEALNYLDETIPFNKLRNSKSSLLRICSCWVTPDGKIIKNRYGNRD